LVAGLLIFFIAGSFGVAQIYLRYHRASALITHSRLYPALITSTMRKEASTRTSYNNIIYVTIVSRDPSQSFPPLNHYRVDTGADSNLTTNPGWTRTIGSVYLGDSTRNDVVFKINDQFWYAQKWDLPEE